MCVVNKINGYNLKGKYFEKFTNNKHYVASNWNRTYRTLDGVRI